MALTYIKNPVFTPFEGGRHHINLDTYSNRRRALAAQLPPNAIALIPAGPVKMRTETAEYRYRQHNDFYYFTGFSEKNALLIITAGDHPQSILFCEPRDRDHECWEGERLGPDRAPATLGVDAAHSYVQCADLLPALLQHKTRYASLPMLNQLPWLREVLTSLDIQSAENLHPITSAMRLIKSDEEIALMQKAADISVKAHQAAMAAVKPGIMEYQLAALYEYVFANEGADAPAYSSIVGGGKNACVLHYIKNSDVLREGDLVLVDAAAEYQGYASDITRTFPVSGKFSGPQRDLYNLVLAAQENAIQTMKPGGDFKRMQQVVVETMTQGLIDLKILKGTLADNIEQKTYRQYYMHSAGHWLGLDVHDVGRYQDGDKPMAFEPNMVMTIEPGLYMSPNDQLDKQWWDIGIRIEDDVCITASGCEILSKALVKTVEDIEHAI